MYSNAKLIKTRIRSSRSFLLLTTYHTENTAGNHGNRVRFSQRAPHVEHSNNIYHVNLSTTEGSNEQTSLSLSLSLSHTHTNNRGAQIPGS
jgi:hypothetical protein